MHAAAASHRRADRRFYLAKQRASPAVLRERREAVLEDRLRQPANVRGGWP